MADFGTLSRCPYWWRTLFFGCPDALIGGGLWSLYDLGHWTVRCPSVEVFCLCLTLALRDRCPRRGGLWSLSDLGRWTVGCPSVEDFGLCLTLALKNHCPRCGGLWSLADLERCPLSILGGLCHFRLVDQMVVQDKSKKRIVQ